MLRFGILVAALAVAGCAGGMPSTDMGRIAAERLARADGFARKADVAWSICAESGRQPGTDGHASCIRALLRAEGERTRARAEVLAARAARMKYTCFDQDQMRLTRCYDI